MNAPESPPTTEYTFQPFAGEVFTFYSYKGGTGRSMLLANVAWSLASAGAKVLLIDWDLEAPGLHRYFAPFLGDDPELRSQSGIIEWLSAYWDAALDLPEESVETIVREYADPRHFICALDTGQLLPGGIDLLCAGRQDANYATAVADFDYTQLYVKLRGEEFIDVAKSILVGPDGYDYVLVDSRTGVSDTSGFCTVVLADTLVVCFTYNNQSVTGASQIARDIKSKAQARRAEMNARAVFEDGARSDPSIQRSFRLFAVPSRVDDLDPDRLECRQKHAWSQFKDLLTDVPPHQQERYWLDVQVRNQGLFAYEEVLAACMNRPNDRQTVLGAVVELTRRLTRGAVNEAPHLADEQRRDLRDRFAQLAHANTRIPACEAWALFVDHVPDSGTRAAVLQGCFPLLSQLYAPHEASASSNEQTLIRRLLPERDLTSAEMSMAEMLTSFGIARRQMTDDKRRALIVSDDSILASWEDLAQRLHDNREFLAARERIQLGRFGWEAGGRSFNALRSLQGAFEVFPFSDEQLLWLGRSNRLMLQLIEEVRSVDAVEAEVRQRLASAESDFDQRLVALSEGHAKQETSLRDQISDGQERLQSMQVLYEERAQALRSHAEELRLQVERTAVAQAEVNRVKTDVETARLKARAKQLMWVTLPVTALSSLALYFFCVEQPMRQRVESLFDAERVSSEANLVGQGTTYGYPNDRLDRMLRAAPLLAKGISGTSDSLQSKLPILVDTLGWMPGIRGRREFHEKYRARVESQVNGLLRVLVSNNFWPVDSAKTGLGTPPDRQKATCDLPPDRVPDGIVSPASGFLYTARDVGPVARESSSSKRMVFINQRKSDTEPAAIWAVNSSTRSSADVRCQAGQLIWQTSNNGSESVAMDSSLQYLFDLTTRRLAAKGQTMPNSSTSSDPPDMVQAFLMKWIGGAESTPWAVQLSGISKAVSDDVVADLKTALNDSTDVGLITSAVGNGVAVAIRSGLSWRLVPSVGPVVLPEGDAKAVSWLKPADDKGACRGIRSAVRELTPASRGTDHGITVFEHAGNCTAIARYLPAQSYVPPNHDIVAVYAFLRPSDADSAVRQVASTDFGIQPISANHWASIDAGSRNGWLTLDVSKAQDGSSMVGTPWTTGAMVAQGRELAALSPMLVTGERR